MAERRMFAKSVIESDAFLDTPFSTQALYVHLSMYADDDGFVSSPKRIQKMIGANDDDLNLLMSKEFIIPFESGVIVIKHWQTHNYIRKDRKHETKFIEEKSLLRTKENGEYAIETDVCQSNVGRVVDKRFTEVRLGKDSIGKDSIGKFFSPPTIEEIKKYCEEEKIKIDSEHFYNYYSAKDWYIGNAKMANWKSAVKAWHKNEKNKNEPSNKFNFTQRTDVDYKKIEHDALMRKIEMYGGDDTEE